MKRDHSKLIYDISELTALFTDTSNLDAFLQNIVEMVAAHMEVEVCSAYLYYEETQELVLRATKGLKPGAIGKVRMKLGEGLTGSALKEMRSICEGDAFKHPGFRHFTGIGEEPFRSFLAVPILRGQNRIGVMTLQSVQKDHSSPEDVSVFRAVTSQLATAIAMAKLLISLKRRRKALAVAEKRSTADLKFIKGRIGAEGFALGESMVVAPPSWEDLAAFGKDGIYTLEDFRRAVAATEKELKDMQASVEEKLFDVASLIFSAQILMLKDRSMLGAMEALIVKGHPPVDAVRSVVRGFAERFQQMPNAFIQEKRYDVIDVGRRLLKNLVGHSSSLGQYAGKVVIARELLPSDALKLSTQKVAGIVLLSGGVTSHVAVLARSLNIPLVIAYEPRLLDIKDSTLVLLDGEQGNIMIEPDDEVVRKFREKEELHKNAAKVRRTLSDETHTHDGVRVILLANINLLGDLAVAKDYKAEGVGLYRTEFPFLVRSDFPTEEEQFVIYRRLVESMKGREITFRTLDIGGDKMLSYYDYSKEANPFLGLRSIRFSLKHRDIFIQQLRAILRASFDSDIRIMFPMISSVDEFEAAQAIVEECLRDLNAEKYPHQPHPHIGAMIELPSIIEVMDELALRAEFFSIGTNDLIQYMLAVDRTNEKVADLYIPYHPAVFRSLKRIMEAALRHGRDVSVCGDMAHDPRYIPFLIGIGVRKFSLDARYLPKIQEQIASLDIPAAGEFAGELLKLTSVSETLRLIERGVKP
jgi:phosphotransferase system enzyme I (PtsP)